MSVQFFRSILTPFILLLFLFGFCSLQSMSVAQAATTYVPTDQPTIQAAIDAATPGDVIVVAPGTYWETIDFGGKAITLRSSDGPLDTTIDGTGLGGSVVQAVSGEGPDTILEGFTITGGYADVGGGMLNIGSSPTVIDCIFTANYADDRGGGMYNREGNPTVIGTTFLQNTAVEMGGGMFNLRASPTVTDCRFIQNIANKGAGMRNYIDSHPTVTDSLFSSNHAGEEGGGMDNRKNSNPVVTASQFIGNTAGSGGGGMHNYVGRATATGNPTIINSLFFGNSAPSGSAMRNNDPDPTIINTTFAYNEGIAISSRNGSAPLITNSIVWGNTGGSIHGPAVVSYSDIEGGWSGTGNLEVDPLFVSTANDDYHLTLWSILIDAGTNAPPLPTTDLDGEPRIMGSTVDMGAYEFGICTVDENFDLDGDGYTVCGGDCDDSNASVNPSAFEIPDDGIDNNCNGTFDEGSGADNTPPVASFGSSCADRLCDFTDISTDSDGSVVSRSWSFGDGAASTSQNPSHTYAASGTYPVTLTVLDDDGDSGVALQSVTVSNLAVDYILPNPVQLPTSTFPAKIVGTGFVNGAQVEFGNGAGPTPKVTDVKVVNPTTIMATVAIKNGGPRRPRMWDLTVTVGGLSVTLEDALTVLP